jgi:hypothetical protein
MWKTDENGAIAATDGNPVWVYESGPEQGKEAPVEFGKTLATIQALTKESISRKEKLGELKAIIAKIEEAGIEDLDAFIKEAKTAMETVKNLTDQQAAQAGEMDRVKQSISDSYNRQIEALKEAAKKSDSEWQAKIDAKQRAIDDLIIRGAFERSDFLREKTTLLPEMAYSYFGGQFKVEEKDGRLVGYAVDRNGDRIMSLRNPGQFADPAEAIEIIINDHPQKERMLRMEANGSGLKAPVGSHDPAANLQAQYRAAKEKSDLGAMIALKQKMHEAGMPVPL